MKACGAEEVDSLKAKWEEEKAELSKMRDEATARAKVGSIPLVQLP